MYKLGIIEESLFSNNILISLKKYLHSQRIEEIPNDTIPIWHIGEYHILESELTDLLPELEKQVQPAWYIHAFNEDSLFVVLHGKSFKISPIKDDSWNDMITYGLSVNVERHYLETIPLHV